MQSDDWQVFATISILWGGVCVFLIARRGWKMSLRMAFVALTGFAVFFALASATGRLFQEHLSVQPWMAWLFLAGGIVGAYITVKASDS